LRKLIIALVFCSTAGADDRISMVDNSGATSIKDVVRGVARAFDKEDLDSYESFFRESRRAYIRRKAALLFADEECSMEIVDVHVIEDNGDNASAAVKYRMGGSSSSFLVLAEVKFVREEGGWKIDRETVRSKASAPRNAASSHAAAIPAGRAPIWDPMRPDPDRIPEEIHHLMGDVGIREGFGCVGGRCNK
jgi:hypothetical protein